MKNILAVLIACSVSGWASVQVNENTITRFSFTWDIDNASIIDSIGAFTKISFKNQNVEVGESGQPIIPGFSFYVGIPPKGNAQIQFTPLSVKTVILKKQLAVSVADKNHKRYPDVSFADSWISNARPAVLGAIRSVQYIIKPYTYNAKTQTLQILERAQCSITFPPSSANASAISAKQSDYQRMVSRLMLNYTIAQRWKTVSPGLAKHGAGVSQFPLSANNPLLSFVIGDGHDSTNEGTTLENGLMKIPGDTLRKLGQTVLMSQIACYASYKGEMPVPTPDISALPDGVTEIPLLRFDLNGNGIVDPEDYVVAYVTGASDWAWDTGSGRFYYRLNRYTDYRHYWIGVKQSGAAMTMKPMAKTSATGMATSTFVNHILFRQPAVISNKGGDVSKSEFSGLDWRWKLLKFSDPSFSYTATLPNIDTAFPALFKINQGYSNVAFTINASFSDAPICSSCLTSQWYPFHYGGNASLRVTADSIGQGDYCEVTGLEFKYVTDCNLGGKKNLIVFSPESASIVQYRFNNLPPEPVYIVRIGADESMQLVDSMTPQAKAQYTWTDSSGTGATYVVCAKSGLLSAAPCRFLPAQATDELTVHNLWSSDNPAANKADFVVITHPDFMEQARKLASHKVHTGRFPTAKAIDVNDIYREFSGGNLDPAAIRNFLVYAVNAWGVKPQYVVLMGKGHYDYKGIVSNEPVFIPVYEWNDRCTDDFFGYLEPGSRVDSVSPPSPSVFLGRLPCIKADQAELMVNKIIATEDPDAADFTAWRNRVLLINDDDMQGSTTDPLGTEHLEASEAVGQTLVSLRRALDVRKVNLFEYPWNDALEKPEARDALISTINSGVCMVNYFGHGNPTQWADEKIFNVQLVAGLTNSKQYPLVSSFSCSVGKFDQPGWMSLSEALVLAGQSGAIATLSGMRQAYSDNNKQLALAFYTYLLDTTKAAVSFGEACAQAKIIVHDQNSQIYSYLGDPSICPFNVRHRVGVKIVNGSGARLDTLKALQTVTVRGSVLAADGQTVEPLFGSAGKPAYVQLTMFNPPRAAKRKDKGQHSDPSYTLPGTPIFTGQLAVKNGVFEQVLHIPRNVVFNKSGAFVNAYAWQGAENGLGYQDFIFNGFIPPDSSGVIDTIGPVIAIRALSDDPNPDVALTTEKIQGSLPFKCEIDIVDSSGIDVTGIGPDEGLTLEIPGLMKKQNINNKFSFVGGDFRKGSATVEFGEGLLKTGAYTLTVSAQDLAGNVSRRSFGLEITADQDLAINQVFNFPNPVKMGKTTAFYFNLTKTSNVRATIKMFAMSGRLLRVFRNARSGEVFDGRDQMGNVLGPKVYLYQITAEDLTQQKTVKSGIQKLVVHPPQ